jgi:hypothetical protein
MPGCQAHMMDMPWTGDIGPVQTFFLRHLLASRGVESNFS